jgi:1,4-alpha-glucan branching enzyme
MNFTPEVRHDYHVRVPFNCNWREVLNTDAAVYGGSNVGNGGLVAAVQDGDSPGLRLTLPPLAALFFVPEM